MAGAGVKAGTTYGETDDFGYNIVKDPVHIHDLNATILHIMGIDHLKLTYRSQGRSVRPTGIDPTAPNLVAKPKIAVALLSGWCQPCTSCFS